VSRVTWRRGSAYCKGKNRDGSPCGNKVPTLPSGAYIRQYCHVHSKRKQAER